MTPYDQENLRNATTAYHGAIKQARRETPPQLWSWRWTMFVYGIRLILLTVFLMFVWEFWKAFDASVPCGVPYGP
jgi:hypothetical protein